MRIKRIRRTVCYSLCLVGFTYIVLVITLATLATNRDADSATYSNIVMDRNKAFDSLQSMMLGNSSNAVHLDASKLFLDIRVPVIPLGINPLQQNDRLPKTFGFEGVPYLKMAADGNVNVPGCSSPISRPFNLGSEPLPEWQPVEDNLSYAFSAFADFYEKEDHVLKIIGIRQVNPMPSSMTCHCRLWYSTSELPVVVGGTIHVIPEGEWPDEYRAVVFKCGLTGDVPYAVTLVQDKCDEAQNLFYVNKLGPPPSEPPVVFTCCVPPLHSQLDDVLSVVEWMEASLLLGAEKFIFYDYSISPQLEVVLRQYQSEGKVVTIPWKSIPVRVSPQLRNNSDAQILYFGQSAAVNDCLYRTVGSSTYTVFMDIDEFIFPREHRSWIDMVRYVEHSQKPNRRTGMYWIRNSFMDKNLPGDPGVLAHLHLVRSFEKLNSKSELLPYLKTMVFTKRRDFLWPYKLRTKMIAIPERVEQMGIHYVHVYRPGFTYALVSPEVAILQHYRHMRNDTDNVVIDLTAHSFQNDLLDRVWNRLTLLTRIP